ncbi:MAG TPA: pilus assembly protein TadG-related protein [Pyrinomonadaceae bacterium]|jgi:Flp pilus assembly protein TadG
MFEQKSDSSRRGERGSILAVSAVGMLAFLLATGLCVDISHFYLVKGELKNAADASALAASSALNSHPEGITEAKRRALEVSNNYDFNNNRVNIAADDVEFAKNLEGPYVDEATARTQAATIRFVRVRVAPQVVGVSFAATVLGATENLASEATAGMSVPSNVTCDIIPLSVVDDDVNTIVPRGTLMPDGTRASGLYIIRAEPQNSVSPGNYQVLSLIGTGASEVRVGIASGVDKCFSPGDEVETKPGVNSGPVRQGINTRFDEYSGGDVNPTDHPPDVNVRENIWYSEYNAGIEQGSGAFFQSPHPDHRGIQGRRVVLIPIIKISQYNNGRDTVQIDRFGAFFLRKKVGGGNGGDIEAEFIGESIMTGRGGYNPNAGPGNPLLVFPVLYR